MQAASTLTHSCTSLIALATKDDYYPANYQSSGRGEKLQNGNQSEHKSNQIPVIG